MVELEGGKAKKTKQMITPRIKHDKGLQVLQVTAGEGTNRILCTQNTHAASAGSCLGQADESKSSCLNLGIQNTGSMHHSLIPCCTKLLNISLQIWDQMTVTRVYTKARGKLLLRAWSHRRIRVVVDTITTTHNHWIAENVILQKNQQQASPLALGAQHISRQGQFLRCPIVQVFKRNLQRMDNIFSSSLSAVASATPTCKGDLIPHIKTSPSMSSQTLGPIIRYQSSTKGRWWRSNCCWSTSMILRDGFQKFQTGWA
jgi:hypothetical protein